MAGSAGRWEGDGCGRASEGNRRGAGGQNAWGGQVLGSQRYTHTSVMLQAETWGHSSGPEAALAGRMRSMLWNLSSLSGHAEAIELGDSKRRSVALLASHARVRASSTWRSLLQTAIAMRPLADADTRTRSLLRGSAGQRAWPLNESKEGFCGVTYDGVEGDCENPKDAGSWNTRKHRVFSFSQCAAK